MPEKPPYEAYESKSKEERREIISASGVLERRRFLLSSSPEMRERLHKVREIVEDMKKDHPEIISFSLFGSMTKGYAEKDSDMDGYLNIDASALGDMEIQEAIEAGQADVNIFNDRLRSETGISYKQTENILGKIHDRYRLKSIMRHADPKPVSQIFLMSVGGNMNEYRKIVLDELEKNGKKGEEVWKEIVGYLIEFENRNFPKELKEKREALYPKTVAGAKKYFLGEEPELIEKAAA